VGSDGIVAQFSQETLPIISVIYGNAEQTITFSVYFECGDIPWSKLEVADYTIRALES
jgi:hypothetical protein